MWNLKLEARNQNPDWSRAIAREPNWKLETGNREASRAGPNLNLNQILDSGFRILDAGFRLPDAGFRIPDPGFWITDS